MGQFIPLQLPIQPCEQFGLTAWNTSNLHTALNIISAQLVGTFLNVLESNMR